MTAYWAITPFKGGLSLHRFDDEEEMRTFAASQPADELVGLYTTPNAGPHWFSIMCHKAGGSMCDDHEDEPHEVTL